MRLFFRTFTPVAGWLLLVPLGLASAPSHAGWSAITTGLDGTVKALAFDAGGRLYAGGDFSKAGSVVVNRLTQWDKSRWTAPWQALDGGVNNTVETLVVDQGSGVVYAGGWFTDAGQAIVAWDGAAWNTLNGGMNGQVYALTLDGTGALLAGGSFTLAGGVAANHIAWWNGAAWQPLGAGLDSAVASLGLAPDGTLYAGGGFLRDGADKTQLNYIARWNGTAWQALADGTTGAVYALAFDSAGHLYAGGHFTGVPGLYTGNIARWDGASWSALGSGLDGPVFDLHFDSRGNLYAAGAFTTAGGAQAKYIARWDGAAWHSVDNGTNGAIHALAEDSAGRLFAAGEFSQAGDIASNRVAYWVYQPSASIRISLAGSEIPDNSGPVDFGSTARYQKITLTFLVENLGDSPLLLGTPNVPAGFGVSEFPYNIPVGASATLGLQLAAQNPGSYAGEFSFDTNAAGKTPFNFSVQGTVLPLYGLLSRPVGNGQVSSAPAGIQCGSDCYEAYAEGRQISLTATPGVGAYFTGWSGDCSGSQPAITVTMNSNLTCTPNFANQPSTYTLSVSVSGSGTITGNGIDCGEQCSGQYPAGTVISLSATPAAGFVFSSWNNAACGAPLTLNQDTQCHALFVAEGVPPACTPNTYEFDLLSGQTALGAACFSGTLRSAGGAEGNPLSVLESEAVYLSASLRPADSDLGQAAGIVLAARYLAPGQAARWFARDGAIWRPWNLNLASLPTATDLTALPESLDAPIFAGSLRGLPGVFTVYFGYRRENRLVYGALPLALTVISENF